MPESRLDALRARFPIDNPEHLFERALNEDQAALSTHILEAFKRPYRFVFRGARCTLPSPRPGPDCTTPGGIRVWEETSTFRMGDRDGRFRR